MTELEKKVLELELYSEGIKWFCNELKKRIVKFRKRMTKKEQYLLEDSKRLPKYFSELTALIVDIRTIDSEEENSLFEKKMHAISNELVYLEGFFEDVREVHLNAEELQRRTAA